MNNANDAAAQRTQTLNLPPHVQATDAAVHAFAARLLRFQYIRSVTVDEHRAAALVRFTTARPASESSEVAACCSAESVDSPLDATSTAPAIVAWFDPRDRSVSFVRMPPRARGWRKGLYLLLSGCFSVAGPDRHRPTRPTDDAVRAPRKLLLTSQLRAVASTSRRQPLIRRHTARLAHPPRPATTRTRAGHRRGCRGRCGVARCSATATARRADHPGAGRVRIIRNLAFADGGS